MVRNSSEAFTETVLTADLPVVVVVVVVVVVAAAFGWGVEDLRVVGVAKPLDGLEPGAC